MGSLVIQLPSLLGLTVILSFMRCFRLHTFCVRLAAPHIEPIDQCLNHHNGHGTEEPTMSDSALTPGGVQQL